MSTALPEWASALLPAEGLGLDGESLAVLIFVAFTALCGAAVFVVTQAGAKEQSFEEALEEQRRKNQKDGKRGNAAAAREKEAARASAKTAKKAAKAEGRKAAAAAAAGEKAEVSEVEVHAEASNASPAPPAAAAPSASKSKKKRGKKSNNKVEEEEASAALTNGVDGGGSAVEEVKSTAAVLEVHRQYLQDDMVEDESDPHHPQSATPDPKDSGIGLMGEALPEEPSPQPSPEPAAAQQQQQQQQGGKGKKKKKGGAVAVVEEKVEVAEVVETAAAAPVVEEEKTQQATASKKKKKQQDQQQAKSDAPAASATGKWSGRDLMTAVKKTWLDESELQQLIELLLNKQAGGGGGGEIGWVDAGKGGQGGESKALQRQLQEKDAALQEEAARNKSITDRMNLLRQELNQAKSQNVSIQRVYEDLQARSQHDVANAQARLQQEIDQRSRDLATLNHQLQMQVTQSNALQSAVDQLEQTRQQQSIALHDTKKQLTALQQQQQQQQQAPAAAAADPAVAAELEELKKVKAKQDEELSALKDRLSKDKDSLEKELAEAKRKLSASEKSEAKSRQELESKLGEVSSRLSAAEGESSRLAEENERLAEQLAANVERPSAEGQEEAVSNGNRQNGVGENGFSPDKAGARLEEETKAWEKKYQMLVQEKDNLVHEKDSALSRLQGEVNTFQSQLKEVQTELESQKAKNNALREKNWKAVEAMNAAEQSYQKVLKQQSQSSNGDVTAAVSKAKSDMDSSHRALLQRLFPDVKMGPAAAGDDFEKWSTSFAKASQEAVSAKVAAAEANAKSSAPAAASKDEDKSEELEKQVAHYKSVLAQTEGMLKSLQSSVESEESGWKAKLQRAESDLAAAAAERDELKKANDALQESIKVVNQAEESPEGPLDSFGPISLGNSGPSSLGTKFAYSTLENAMPRIIDEMQDKLRELQQKLSGEESEKADLLKKVGEAEKKLKDRDDLEKEVSSLRQKLESERNKSLGLGARVAQLGQSLSASQEALGQEKKTVEALTGAAADIDAKQQQHSTLEVSPSNSSSRQQQWSPASAISDDDPRPGQANFSYPLFPALAPSFVASSTENILSDELAEAEKSVIVTPHNTPVASYMEESRKIQISGSSGSHLTSRTVVTASSSSTSSLTAHKRLLKEEDLSQPGIHLTEDLERELEESRRRLKERQEEEMKKQGEGGGLLASLAKLKSKYGDADNIDDEDFEEMADTIQSILSGGSSSKTPSEQPMPSRTVPAKEKPPRKDKTETKEDKKASSPDAAATPVNGPGSEQESASPKPKPEGDAQSTSSGQLGSVGSLESNGSSAKKKSAKKKTSEA